MRRMKTLLATVLALSVLAGAATTVLASTDDDGDFPSNFWTRQDRNGP
jgi:hypothetical protein